MEEDQALPTPHLRKLQACLVNPRLPQDDVDRVQQSLEKYHTWIGEMNEVQQGADNSVDLLVAATNTYKRFIELDLIFDSPNNFLYRQKGQLKLDNTILEEFLPHLFKKALKDLGRGYEFGPKKTFSNLTFSSALGDLGNGGKPILKAKDQDFLLGKKLYIKSSFDKDFANADSLESHIGYVCAECKTNLDKTMFQEAAATSRDLKSAVPSSFYFLICEFLDMTPVPITSTNITDVLIVRKSKRLNSNIRQQYRTPQLRQQHREAYIDFLDNAPFQVDVFQRMIDKVQKVIDDASIDSEQVVGRGHF